MKVVCRTKNSASAYVYLPLEWTQGAQKIDMIEILYSTGIVNYIQFKTQRCKKYASHQRNLHSDKNRNTLLSDGKSKF